MHASAGQARNGMGVSFFGFSAIIASVVISSPAIELSGSIDTVGRRVILLALLGIIAMVIAVILADFADHQRKMRVARTTTRRPA